MGLQRTFIGVLVAITSREHGAVAVPHGSFQDLVALLQHPVTGTSAGGEASRPGAHVSLLAVGAGAGTKWYETSAEDEALVRKLNGRMKANEQSEELQAELAEASNASGATFLSRSSGGGALAKDQHRQLLTRQDLEHILEDEDELERLAVQLQRIATEVQRIAKHQLEFGLHLGLPDPNIEQYLIGDKVELQMNRGKNKGKWVKAVIKGFGPRINTYQVHIPSAKEGTQDLSKVPANHLRRDEEVTKGWDMEPAAMKYEVDEQAQIKVSTGYGSQNWVKCVIKSKGEKPDTYNIHIPAAPTGHKDQSDVPAQSLRKGDPDKLFSQYDVDGDGLLSDQEFIVAVKEKANIVKINETHNGGEETALFAAGEPAEVVDDKNGSAVACTIMAEGDLADSYNIFVPSFPVGFQYMPNVQVDKLRKIGQQKDAFDNKVNLIPPFVDHEVIAPRGIYKGRWVPCQLKRKAQGESYTVWMPFGVAKGHNTAANIPPSKIRVRKTCGAGYDDIFNGDAPGGDYFGRLSNQKDTVEACAADCNKRLECLSFEYTATTKDCNLNRILNPTLPGSGDQMFCRRKEVPKMPAALWEGPRIGQPLEYAAARGEQVGEWRPCTVLSFGKAPDTYSINTSSGHAGGGNTSAVLADIPIKFLRYGQDKPVKSLADRWVPPEGEDAVWVNQTNESAAANATESQDAAEEKAQLQNFLVANARLRDNGDDPGLFFHASKRLNDTIGTNAYVPWGSYVLGRDEGDGWIRVGDTFLPNFVKGLQVITPRINGEPGELVQVKVSGAWHPGTIRSLGDKANTYNVRLLKSKSGSHVDNVPAARIRKDISAPLVAASTTLAPAAAKPPPAAAAKPADRAVVEKTTTAAPAVQAPAPTTTMITQEEFDAQLEHYIEKLKQEEREKKKSESVKTAATETQAKATEFLVDNRLLHHKGPGLSYRRSKRLDDANRSDVVLWGTYVKGEDEGDGWLRVGDDKYLPTFVRGMPVITQKVVGDSGEIVQVEQDDGSWAHATIRSKGDWPETFNVHAVYNGEGYDLENVPLRRLRRSLEAPMEHPAPLKEVAGLEVAAPSEADRLLEGGDLGEDLPDGVFRANMTAEVKINAGPQAGRWVRCRIVDQGDISDTYNLYVPSAPKGYEDMRNIPVLAMRKCHRSAALAAPSAAEGSSGAAAVSANHSDALASDANIDGEPGESVEVLIRKGSKAGKWLPAVIIKPGNVTDCFDIRLPGLRGTHKDVVNVPGMRLRKAGFKVEIAAEPDYPVYVPGEHAVIDVVLGDGRTATYNCTVQQKGEFSNTYDVAVPGEGSFPGVHAKYMRKVAFAAWMVSTQVTTTTPEPSVLNFRAFMYLAEGMRADLGPVLSEMAKSKKDMKLWLSRAKEWPDSCQAEDRAKLLAKMEEVSKATDAQVNASVPRECWRSSWNQTGGGGVLWDDLGKCFAVASGVTPNCAFCGVKLLLNVAAGCLAKCQSMMTVCRNETQAEACPVKTGRCAECLEDPAERFLQCSGLPGRADLSDAMGDFSKSAKAGTLDVAAALLRHVSPAYFDQVDHVTKLGLGVVWRTWKVVFGN